MSIAFFVVHLGLIGDSYNYQYVTFQKWGFNMYDDTCTTEIVPRNTKVKNGLPIKFKIILAFSVLQVHLLFFFCEANPERILSYIKMCG